MRVVAKDYQQLIAALSHRRRELRLTLAELDGISGLSDRHCSKILAPNPTKFLGPMSLFCLLPSLGLKITISDDPEALAAIRRRLRVADTSITSWLPRAAPTEPAKRGAVTSAA